MKKYLFYILFWFFATMASIGISAQNDRYHFRHISQKDGLTKSEVMSVVQDSMGFMWIGTLDGLFKYNGYSMKAFYHAEDDSTSMPAKKIYHMDLGTKNILWIIGWTDLGYMDVLTEKFYKIKLPHKKRIKWRLTMGNGSELLFAQMDEEAGYDRVYKFNSKSNQLTEINVNIPNIQGYQLEYAAKDEKGNIVLLHGNTIYQLSPKNANSYNALPILNIQKNGPQKDRIYTMIKDSFGKWWAGSVENYLYYQENGDVLTPFTKIKEFPGSPNILVTSMHIFEEDKKIWFVGRRLVAVYDLLSNEYTTITHETGNPNSILEQSVRGHWKDESGNRLIWNFLGVSILTEKKSPFSHFLVDPSDSDRVGINSIFTIHQDKNEELWIGAPKYGLLHLDKEKNTLKKIHKENPRYSELTSNSFSSICRDRSGNLWIGSFYGGLYKLVEKGKLQKINFIDDGDKKRFIRRIKEDGNGNIWIVRVDGLSKYNPKTENFTHVEMHPKKADIKGAHFFDIIFDKNNIAWFEGGEGLVKIDLLANSFKVVADRKINVYCIGKDEVKNKLYLGTQSNGLARYDIRSEKYDKFYDRKDGLEGGVVYGILQDNHRNLWLSTNKGISKFNMETEQFTNYGKKDGLPFEDFNTGAFYKGVDGQFYFGGEYGVVHFDPEKISDVENNFSPNVVLTSCKILGEPLKSDVVVSYLDTIELMSSENYVEFEFASLDFSYPNEIVYQYKMEGLDKEWSKPDKRNYASYANMPYGKYQFKVRGSNAHGNWSDKELNVHLIIKPYFFERKEIRAVIIVLLLSGLIFGGYKWMERKNKLKEEKLKQENKEREEKLLSEIQDGWLMALRSQMKKHFVFNVLNAVNNFISKADVLTANEYLTKTAQFLRLELDNSEKPVVSLKQEIEGLDLYVQLQHIRFADKFDYFINVDEKLDLENILIPSMILQPFVENAIEHGLHPKEKKGILTLGFKKENNDLVCTVEDNGIGRKEAEELKKMTRPRHRSLGMKNVENRLARINEAYRINADLKIVDLYSGDGEPEGTKVEFIFPLDFKIK